MLYKFFSSQKFFFGFTLHFCFKSNITENKLFLKKFGMLIIASKVCFFFVFNSQNSLLLIRECCFVNLKVQKVYEVVKVRFCSTSFTKIRRLFYIKNDIFLQFTTCWTRFCSQFGFRSNTTENKLFWKSLES